MRILITGAAGFIGRAVTRELGLAGHELTLITHRRKPPADVPTRCGDIRDADFVGEAVQASRPEGICHLAALTGVRDSECRVMDFFDVNVGGMINLLSAVRSVERQPTFVFASSRAVYTPGDGRAISEDSGTEPESPYGLSKLIGERLLTFSGLPAWTLRCFNVSGGVDGIVDPDTNRLIPRLLAAARGELPPPTIQSPDAALDYSHVVDVARAFRLAVEAAPQPGEHRIVNVGSGVATSIRDILQGLGDALGRPVPAVVQPSVRSAGPDDVTVADISAIRDLLKWQPDYSLTDILTDAVTNEEGRA